MSPLTYSTLLAWVFVVLVGYSTRCETQSVSPSDVASEASQDQSATTPQQPSQIQLVGASSALNDFTTGFVQWADQETPRYNSPKVPQLPPLPEQYRDDVEYIGGLRRGPYPDLVAKRPEALSPAATDPLQNGQIATLPPGPAYAGVLSEGVPVPPGR